MLTRIRGLEDEIYVDEKCEIAEYIICFNNILDVNRKIGSVLDVYNSAFVAIEAMGIGDELKDVFRELTGYLNNFGELAKECEDVVSRLRGNYKEIAENMLGIYERFDMTKPYTGDIVSGISEYDVMYLDEAKYIKVKNYILKGEKSDCQEDSMIDDNKICAYKRIGEEEDFIVEFIISSELKNKIKGRFASFIKVKDACKNKNNLDALKKIMKSINVLSVNPGDISNYGYFDMSNFNVHIETIQAINKILCTYNYLMNSCSFRDGEYHCFDRMRIESDINYAKLIQERALDVMRHQFRSNNW